MAGCISSGVIECFIGCFVTIERHCHLLDFKMHGIIERRLPSRPNAVCCNFSERDSKFIELCCDLDLLQNLIGSRVARATLCHQVL